MIWWNHCHCTTFSWWIRVFRNHHLRKTRDKGMMMMMMMTSLYWMNMKVIRSKNQPRMTRAIFQKKCVNYLQSKYNGFVDGKEIQWLRFFLSVGWKKARSKRHNRIQYKMRTLDRSRYYENLIMQTWHTKLCMIDLLCFKNPFSVIPICTRDSQDVICQWCMECLTRLTQKHVHPQGYPKVEKCTEDQWRMFGVTKEK